jgi:hypothetical protein
MRGVVSTMRKENRKLLKEMVSDPKLTAARL